MEAGILRPAGHKKTTRLMTKNNNNNKKTETKKKFWKLPPPSLGRAAYLHFGAILCGYKTCEKIFLKGSLKDGLKKSWKKLYIYEEKKNKLESVIYALQKSSIWSSLFPN